MNDSELREKLLVQAHDPDDVVEQGLPADGIRMGQNHNTSVNVTTFDRAFPRLEGPPAAPVSTALYWDWSWLVRGSPNEGFAVWRKDEGGQKMTWSTVRETAWRPFHGYGADMTPVDGKKGNSKINLDKGAFEQHWRARSES